MASLFVKALLAAACLPASTSAIDAHKGVMFLKHRASSSDSGFVRGLEFKHRLRVCNAYPIAGALDVYRGKDEKLTTDGPMPYKACKDLSATLQPGDKLDFKMGSESAGTFSVSDLPSNDAVMLLVIHRHDTQSTAASFESHVFANLVNAQIAIIDTYKGKARAIPKIKDEANKGSRSEELRYNSVVAVNSGKYDVVLDDSNGKEVQKQQLVALEGESYVIMRTGVESPDGDSYPEELLVYPQSSPTLLHSGCTQLGVSMAVAVSVALTSALAW